MIHVFDIDDQSILMIDGHEWRGSQSTLYRLLFIAGRQLEKISFLVDHQIQFRKKIDKSPIGVLIDHEQDCLAA